MVCKKRGVYGVLGVPWVLITYNICTPCNVMLAMSQCEETASTSTTAAVDLPTP